jgi:hypothetical protein
MNDISLLSASLQESIQKEMRKQNKMNVLNGAMAEEKLTLYKQLILEQENLFTQNDENIVVRHIEVSKNADLWLSRTGWAKYLEGFTAPAIHEVTLPFDVVEEQLYVQLETNFVQSVKDTIQYVRKIDSIHHIFYTVQCRPNQPYPSKPFQVPSEISYERYLSSIQMIFRIIIRIYNYQKRNEDGIHTRYPTITFSLDQNIIIDMIQSHPNTQQNYIDLLLELAGQTYTSHPYQCSLICTIAFMSLNPDATFKQASQFTGIYAAILAVYKVLVIHKSMTQASDDVTQIGLAIQYTQQYLSHPENINSNPNVMSYVINVLSYAFTISRNSPVKGFIAWSEDVLIFRNVRLSMVDFRSAILQNYDDAERLLLCLCEVTSMNQLPLIPWETTIDDINNSSYNYSFITEPQNNYVESSKVFNSRRNMQLWISDDGTFNVDHVKLFKQKVKSFLECLLCLVHVCGGQPARGTEIIILQHTNSSSSSKCSRNIYIDRGLVCIFSQYHKSIIKSNQTKDIFRFLPPTIGNLMVYYLWLVLPYYLAIPPADPPL